MKTNTLNAKTTRKPALRVVKQKTPPISPVMMKAVTERILAGCEDQIREVVALEIEKSKTALLLSDDTEAQLNHFNKTLRLGQSNALETLAVVTEYYAQAHAKLIGDPDGVQWMPRSYWVVRHEGLGETIDTVAKHFNTFPQAAMQAMDVWCRALFVALEPIAELHKETDFFGDLLSEVQQAANHWAFVRLHGANDGAVDRARELGEKMGINYRETQEIAAECMLALAESEDPRLRATFEKAEIRGKFTIAEWARIAKEKDGLQARIARKKAE